MPNAAFSLLCHQYPRQADASGYRDATARSYCVLVPVIAIAPAGRCPFPAAPKMVLIADNVDPIRIMVEAGAPVGAKMRDYRVRAQSALRGLSRSTGICRPRKGLL